MKLLLAMFVPSAVLLSDGLIAKGDSKLKSLYPLWVQAFFDGFIVPILLPSLGTKRFDPEPNFLCYSFFRQKSARFIMPLLSISGSNEEIWRDGKNQEKFFILTT